MEKRIEPFKVPDGRMHKCFRYKVRRPRIVSFSTEGNYLMALLSCGHTVKYCRIPKWTRCYQCKVETLHFEKPVGGYKEIPITNTTPQ